MANGPQCVRLPIPPTATLPSCLWLPRIFPSLPGSRLTIFYRGASSTTRQPMVEFYFNSRSHHFRYGRQNKNPTFDENRTHDFRTKRCAGYLLDHSGDESEVGVIRFQGNVNKQVSPLKNWRGEPFRASQVDCGGEDVEARGSSQ